METACCCRPFNLILVRCLRRRAEHTGGTEALLVDGNPWRGWCQRGLRDT